jgi:hypothetical protein
MIVTKTITVRDVVNKKDVQLVDGSLAATVPSHGVALFVVTWRDI